VTQLITLKIIGISEDLGFVFELRQCASLSWDVSSICDYLFEPSSYGKLL
jgi:hypothetical protein